MKFTLRLLPDGEASAHQSRSHRRPTISPMFKRLALLPKGLGQIDPTQPHPAMQPQTPRVEHNYGSQGNLTVKVHPFHFQGKDQQWRQLNVEQLPSPQNPFAQEVHFSTQRLQPGGIWGPHEGQEDNHGMAAAVLQTVGSHIHKLLQEQPRREIYLKGQTGRHTELYKRALRQHVPPTHEFVTAPQGHLVLRPKRTLVSTP